MWIYLQQNALKIMKQNVCEASLKFSVFYFLFFWEYTIFDCYLLKNFNLPLRKGFFLPKKGKVAHNKGMSCLK